jgi:phosphoesterase RecJ-like protein
MAKLHKTIKAAKNFLISTHVNPDPDALASELAMALFLISLGKKVTILNEDPLPRRFSFFPGARLIKSLKQKISSDYDAYLIVDCGDLQRIGKVTSLIKTGKPIVNIDHHITNDRFGTVNVVLPRASSTAEIIYEILEGYGFKMTRQIAVLLYMGIMTDTGSFRYDNTGSKTHAVVSRLLQFRIPVSDLYRRLYESIPFSDLKYFAQVVNGIQPLFGGKIICLELSRKVVKKFSQDFDLRDKIFNYLRAIKGVEILVILTEQGKNQTRVNFRSQGRFNVARLAAQFHGGGHRKASGCLLEKPMAKAKQRILDEIQKTYR